MADNKDEILLKLKIEENRALKKLKEVKESVNNLDRRTKKYKNTVREQVALESKLISVRKQRITLNKQMETSVKGLTKAQIQKKTLLVLLLLQQWNFLGLYLMHLTVLEVWRITLLS